MCILAKVVLIMDVLHKPTNKWVFLHDYSFNECFFDMAEQYKSFAATILLPLS